MFPGLQGLLKGHRSTLIFNDRIGQYLSDHRIGNGKSRNILTFNLRDDGTKAWGKQVAYVDVMLQLYAETVSEGHLADCWNDSPSVRRESGYDSSVSYILIELLILGKDFLIPW